MRAIMQPTCRSPSRPRLPGRRRHGRRRPDVRLQPARWRRDVPAAAEAGRTRSRPIWRIAPDSTVTVLSAHMDMGQGVYTGVATLVAEELDADWSQMRVEGAAGNPKLYGNRDLGRRRPGHRRLDRASRAPGTATARRARPRARCWSQAAAEAWGVPGGEIQVENGVARHARASRRASASWPTRRHS